MWYGAVFLDAVVLFLDTVVRTVISRSIWPFIVMAYVVMACIVVGYIVTIELWRTVVSQGHLPCDSPNNICNDFLLGSHAMNFFLTI